MNQQERLDRLDTMISEGRLIRGDWTNGEDHACLLAALAPEAGEAKNVSACPAAVMPRWLAELTPWIDDSGSSAQWPAQVRRYANVARRWHVLQKADWRRLDFEIRAFAVREARSHVPASAELALSAIDGVLVLLDSEAQGRPVASWSDAGTAALYASRSSAGYVCTYQATYAAYYAAAAANTALAAVLAVSDAADAIFASSDDATTGSGNNAVDQLIHGILAAIERACSSAEAK